MMDHSRRLLSSLFLIGVTLLPRALAAQGPGWTLLADRTYHGGSFEPARIFLARRFKYRLEFSEPGVLIQMRSYEGKSVPFARLLGDGPGVSGETQFELAPNSDGIIEFNAVDGVAGVATRFRVWQLPEPAEVEVPSDDIGGSPVEFGVIIHGGAHLPYLADSFTYAHQGSVGEGCLAIRGGSGILERLNGCIVGYARLSGGFRYALAFTFTEPRFRIVGSPVHQGLTLSAGALLRFSGFSGTWENDPKSPPISSRGRLGGGVYVALDQRGAHRHGFRADAELLVDGVGAETDGPSGPSTPQPGTSHAASIRVGGGWFF